MSAGKISVIAYAMITSPIVGLTFLGYMIHKDNQVKNLQRQLEAIFSERKTKEKAIHIENINDVRVNGNITNFEVYKGCIIENYQNRFYRIQKPSGEYLNKIFLTQDDAKQEIDTVEPFLVKPNSPERRKVHNIRYVR